MVLDLSQCSLEAITSSVEYHHRTYLIVSGRDFLFGWLESWIVGMLQV